MKPVLAVFVSALIAGHTFGHYLPNEYQTASCGCGGNLADIEYNLGSPQLEEATPDDTRYKFNFEVEQPKASESQPDLKSYAYDIQEPPTEPKADDTKYKFDYTIQTPAEDKVAEDSEPKTYYTKVDRLTQDKPECGCRQGKPCSCGYSPEQCATHCNPRSPHNAGYVLPVRYDNGGDYVVYEMPQTETEYLRRNARQVLDPAEAFKAVNDRIREAIAQITSGPANGPQLGSTLGSPFDPSAIKETFDQLAEHPLVQNANKFMEGLRPQSNGPQLGSTLGAAFDPSAIQDTFNQFADPFVQHATKLVEGFKQTFAVPTRRRRDADVRMPMLRVKEYEGRRDKSDKRTEDYSKYLTASRVELKPSKKQEWNMKEAEAATQCTSCGSKLTESTCKRCGTYQPQYVEYVEGKPVPYYPGAAQAKSMETPTAEPRYIHDRYGHRYLENNGNLRLVAPQYNDQYQEAIVADQPSPYYASQPDYAGLADILNRNKEVMAQMNRTPGRLVPQPADYASSAIDLIRDLSRQNPIEKRETDEKEQKPEQSMTAEWKKTVRPLPRSMYQIVPMNYEGKEGKLAVKVYSAKNSDKTKSSETTTTETESTNSNERSEPTVKKFTKNNKQFEILSFDDYKTTSDEEIRGVLDHLHGKQNW